MRVSDRVGTIVYMGALSRFKGRNPPFEHEFARCSGGKGRPCAAAVVTDQQFHELGHREQGAAKISNEVQQGASAGATNCHGWPASPPTNRPWPMTKANTRPSPNDATMLAGRPSASAGSQLWPPSSVTNSPEVVPTNRVCGDLGEKAKSIA